MGVVHGFWCEDGAVGVVGESVGGVCVRVLVGRCVRCDIGGSMRGMDARWWEVGDEGCGAATSERG